MRQADGQREHIGVHYVIRPVPVCSVELDQHTPEGDGMVWHPAQKERQHHNGDRSGDLGSPFGVAGFHTPVAYETQEHDVADGHDGHGQNKTYNNFLDVVNC